VAGDVLDDDDGVVHDEAGGDGERHQGEVVEGEFELMLAIGLVVMVIFLFLRSFSATLIPSLSVPLSLIAGIVA
jgi:multidrug efflux pump subunit AcrB